MGRSPTIPSLDTFFSSLFLDPLFVNLSHYFKLFEIFGEMIFASSCYIQTQPFYLSFVPYSGFLNIRPSSSFKRILTNQWNNLNVTTPQEWPPEWPPDGVFRYPLFKRLRNRCVSVLVDKDCVVKRGQNYSNVQISWFAENGKMRVKECVL